MRTLFTLAAKDLKLLWRDKFGLFWVVGFPLVMAIFFGAIFSGGSGGKRASMQVALVDEDLTETSRFFAERLNNSDVIDIMPMGIEEARDRVRRGKLVAYLVLRKGFGESSPFFSGGGSPIQVGIDPGRKAEAGYLEGLVTRAYMQTLFDRYSDPSRLREQIRGLPKDLENDTTLPPEQRKIFSTFISSLDTFLTDVDKDVYSSGPSMEGFSIEREDVLRESSGPRSSWELTFPQSIAWALVGCVAAFAVSIVVERTRGTFLRLRMAPISRAHILGGKALACFLASLTVLIFLLLVGKIIFHIRIQSPALLALALFCTSLCFVGIMMFISVLGKTEQAVGGTGWAILLIMAMFGGGMIPLMIMPSWMKVGSSFSPIKWAILSIEGAIWRGFSLQEMLFPCGILLGVGVLFFSAGLLIFSRGEA